MEPVSETVELQQWLKKIKHKLVRARSAFACCKKGFNRAAQFNGQLLQLIEETIEKHPREALVTPLPRLEPWIGVRTPAYSEKLVIGFLDLRTGEQVSEFPMPLTAPQLEDLKKFVNITSDLLRRQTKDCKTCVDKALLKQSKKRQYGTWKAKDGTQNQMRIRVVHE
jgi:hypothetical protein